MNIEQVIGQFAIAGELKNLKATKEGLINTTYISTFLNENGSKSKYTHQRLNRSVFTDPEGLMNNILAITAHLQKKVANRPDAHRRSLSLVPSKTGAWWVYDSNGELWRTYHFIDEVNTYSFLSDVSLAYRFGKAIATFQADVADFPSETLQETIPNFHHMERRYEQFEDALSRDRVARAKHAAPEIEFFVKNKERAMVLTEALVEEKVPLRVTHNDTKVSNILFDSTTGEGICMIDLDTVMGGSLLFDTGDMIRTGCITAAEDEPDLNKVRFNRELFVGLIGGYRSVANTFLTEVERSLLVESGRTITLIMGIRMLTDYLAGDTYYQTEYPEHNLIRSRTQIKLIQEMDSQWEALLEVCK